MVDVQSIGKAIKYLAPRILKYNHPPTKKPRNVNANAKSEVHDVVVLLCATTKQDAGKGELSRHITISAGWR